MSLSLATAIEEPLQAEVEALSDLEAPPATDVKIHAAITPDSAGDRVKFSISDPVDGVTASGSDIIVTKANAAFNLRITLTPMSGFTFLDPAILWVSPSQTGFGTGPIHPIEEGTVAVIPNTTGAKGSGVTAQFALYLRDSSNGLSVIIDPTIIDDPNT